VGALQVPVGPFQLTHVVLELLKDPWSRLSVIGAFGKADFMCHYYVFSEKQSCVNIMRQSFVMCVKPQNLVVTHDILLTTATVASLDYMLNKCLGFLGMSCHKVFADPWTTVVGPIRHGSSYTTAHGSWNLKPYSTTSCNMTATHNKNALHSEFVTQRHRPGSIVDTFQSDVPMVFGSPLT